MTIKPTELDQIQALVLAEPKGKKPEGGKLDAKKLLFVTYWDQRFWETGSVPSIEKTASDLQITEDEVKGYLSHPGVRSALVARGVDVTDLRSNDFLTPEQVVVANLVLNLHDKRTVREKLDSVGISSQRYHAWLRQATFANYLRKRAESMFEATDSDAYAGLIDAVKNKDLNAIKLFFEMRGIYNPRLKIDVDVNMVVMRVVEIVSRHVKDSTILSAIADDIENLQLEAGMN